MATKVKTGVIDAGAITSALITDASITADDLHTTLDLTGKTVTVATASASDNDTSVASTAYVTTAIANLADSAPSTLNTLNELAAALGDDANFSTTVTNSIATKLPLAGGTLTGGLVVQAATGQLRLQGTSNTNKNVSIFYNESADYGQINVDESGVNQKDLWITGLNLKFGRNTSSESVRILSDGSIKHFSGAGTLHLQALGGSSNLIEGSGSLKIKAVSGSVDLLNGSLESLNTTAQGITVNGPNSADLIINAPTDNASLSIKAGTSDSGAEAAVVAFYQNTSPKWQMGNITTNEFRLYNYATSAAAILVDTSSNVGIGTTNPGAKLHVQTSHTQTDVTGANSNSTLNIANSGSGNGVYNAIKFAANQQDMYIMSFNNNQQADRRIGFFLGSVAGDATTDERLSILGNGNVGIGTPTPATTLEVNGPMSIRSSNYLYFGQSNTSIGTWTTRQYASGNSHQFNAQTFSFNRTGYASDELLYMDTNGMYVSPINHGHTRMNSLSSTSLAPSAGDWIDIATIPYGRNTAKVKFLWDGVSSPSSAHHGMMEFAIGSHYGTSYYYGWDSYINLLSSSAHNSFHIEEARIITPNGAGATGVFQVRFQGATTGGVWRSYVTERDESCSIQPLTPVVNNSRTGSTIARLDLSAAKGGAVTSRVHMAVSKDLHVQGGITIANQPGFSAYKNGSINEAVGNTIIGPWIERYDVGGKFNHTSGRFTATTKGKYLFTMGIMAGQTTGDVQYRINKNGAIYANSNSMAQGGGPWRFTTVVATVHLEDTDYVEFVAYSNTNSNNEIVYNSTFSHVSGHFLG